jgi:ADP-ribose pyrophosphatase YjhB (NUDIX family)
VLIYTIFKTQVMLLLGLEQRERETCWMPFGGKREGEETPYQTAIRECYEETLGTMDVIVNNKTPIIW